MGSFTPDTPAGMLTVWSLSFVMLLILAAYTANTAVGD
jgi:hypothetical protein